MSPLWSGSCVVDDEVVNPQWGLPDPADSQSKATQTCDGRYLPGQLCPSLNEKRVVGSAVLQLEFDIEAVPVPIETAHGDGIAEQSRQFAS